MAVEELQEAGSPRIAYRDLRSRAEELADEAIKEKVLRGIEALDKQYGPNWVDHIDPNELIMSSSTSCVLGQLYGDYDEGAISLWGTEESYNGAAEASGFFSSYGGEEYHELDRAWKHVLT